MRNVTAENGKHIQHVLVADATGLCKWEDFMGVLQPNKSYQLCNFYVQEFRNKKYISNRIQGSRIEEIPDVDIGSIDPDSYVDKEAEITNPIIGAVLKLEHFMASMRCKSRVEPIASNQGRCTNDCFTLQHYDLCTEHVSSKLLLKRLDATPGEASLDITISNKMLKDFTGAKEYSGISENLIMSLPTVTSLKYNKDNFQVMFTKWKLNVYNILTQIII